MVDICEYNDNAICFSADTKEGFTKGTPINSSNDIPVMTVYGYQTGAGAENNW